MMKSVHISKDYDIWICKIVFEEEKCPHIKKIVYIEHKIVYILLKIVYIFKSMDIEFTELCTFFKYLDIECTNLILSLICDEKCSHIKKLCALNIQNCVCSLKICVHWIYRIV